MSATEVRRHFGEVLRYVAETKRPVYVERYGKPWVVIIAIEEYERLMAGRAELGARREG
jgi:prevent-host-death family protein